MALTITAKSTEVARLDDGRIIIVKPPALRCTHESPCPTPRETNDCCEFVPPADLVAVTKACQTCAGAGNVYPPRGKGVVTARCGPCRGTGRPLFDLKVECPDRLHQPPPPVESWYDDPSGYRPGDPECRQCDESGWITYAGLYVPGPLLPVVGDRKRPPAWVWYDDERDSWVLSQGDEWESTDETVDLPADAAPGGSAVIAERSET